MTIEIITENIKLFKDLKVDNNTASALNSAISPENYSGFLRDSAGSIPLAYIFIELARRLEEQKYSALLTDILENYPEVVSVLANFYFDKDFKDLFDKIREISQDPPHLYALKTAINKLEAGELKQTYENYYKALETEITAELSKANKLDHEKILYYRDISIKYFKLMNIVKSDIPQTEKLRAITEAYEFSHPSWMPKSLKLATVILITALGAAAGFVIGGVISGGIAAVPTAILVAYGLFRKSSLERAASEIDQSLRNCVRR